MSIQSHNLFMPEKDLLYTILANLKRTCREYTTATTESACPVLRKMFMQLTQDSLRIQGELFYLMQQHNMYETPSKAPHQQLDKELQSVLTTRQTCQQFLQSKHTNK